MFQQIDQQIEHLRFKGDQRAVVPQLAPIDVKCMIVEEELHTSSRQGGSVSGIIGGFSATNQVPRKVFRPPLRHPSFRSIAIFAIGTRRRKA
jgi:hypothetical protein